MKLQNFIIIFIIIILPIILIFSLYLNLETKTITIQTDYDEKLIEATKEAVEAFEINTVEWNSKYSSLANIKRQDLMSSINVFTTSLSNKLGIGGSSRENILSYIPAIVYIMYDGYYIYSPTNVPETITNENGVQLFYYEGAGSNETKVTASATQNIGGTIVDGEPMYVYKEGEITGTYNSQPFTTDISSAEKKYKHVLKTFVPYTSIEEDYIVNYTLDNYIRIYGEIQSKEGYVVEDFGRTNTIEVPVNSVSDIKANGNEILAETLTENIYVREDLTQDAVLQEYPYIYNSNNDKRYYDSSEDKFFMLNDKNVKVFLPESYVGHTLAEYKKLLIRRTDTEYLELYQILNSDSLDNKWYYKEGKNKYLAYEAEADVPINGRETIARGKDCSAINYYVETYCFNKWLRGIEGINLSEEDIQDLLNNKNQKIIENINNNLNLSISNYNANSGMDYKIFELADEDWEQALSNISMITFFQGIKAGLKTYNNYAVVTSTENNEFVREDSLYYIGENNDEYYHRYYCNQGTANKYQAYRNTEFKVKSYDVEDSVKYYYKHNGSSGEEVYECFDCIVNRNNYERFNK